MKTKKKIVSLLLTISMLLTLFPFAAFAEEAGEATDSVEIVLPEDVTADDFGENTVYYEGNYYKTLVEALKAAAGVEGAVLYCKPAANVGDMTHGHVCASMTVYGNGATVANGENDFEVDTYKGDGAAMHKGCPGLTKDLTLTIYALNNSGVWGQRTTNHTINIVMENCKNADRVYISEGKGTNHITLKGNTYFGKTTEGLASNLAVGNCVIYSNAAGKIVIEDCEFSNVPEPINLNKKGSGDQDITVKNTTFNNCATKDIVNDNDKTYASGIRVIRTSGGSSHLTVDGCTFNYDGGKEKVNGDILLGDGRSGVSSLLSKDVTMTIVNTEAEVQMHKGGYYDSNGNVADASKLRTETVTKSNAPVDLGIDETFSVAKIGDKYYNSLEQALRAVKDGETITLTKDITVAQTVIVDKGTKAITIDGAGNTITGTTDGVILDIKYEDGTNVAVENLTLKGNNGGGLLQWNFKDAYKDIDTPSTTPKLSVTGCTFSSDDGAQTGAGIGLWGKSPDWTAKAKSEVVVDGCTFDTMSAGIYYNEEAPLMNLQSTVINNDFKNLSWTGTAGIPANAEIAYNHFYESCNYAIQYLINGTQTATNTSIHDNIIDSKNGIQFMPYHFDEGNDDGRVVTQDMLPEISRNIRHTDTNLVTIVGYRGGTDEKLVFGKDTVLDLNENYTQGTAPTIDVTVQDGPNKPDIKDVTPPVKNDSYYEEETMKPEDLNTYQPPVAVTRYDINLDIVSNGTVDTDKTRASRGTTVTVTALPDDGYVVDSVVVTVQNGEKVEVTKKDDNTYTFKMPQGDVTVTVTFKTESGEPSDLPFTDVADDAWYYPAVEYVFNNDLMNGTGDTTFAPNMNLDRAMMAAVLYNMEGKPDAAESGIFSDVEEGKWYTDAVNWAASNDIVSGLPGGIYAPNQALTREQMASILYRYAEYKGIDVSARADLDPFTDGDTVSPWANDVVQWAVAEKIINGNGDTLQPKGTASRAQVATVLMNFCENVAK